MKREKIARIGMAATGLVLNYLICTKIKIGTWEKIVLCILLDFILYIIIKQIHELLLLPINVLQEKRIFADLTKNDFRAKFAGSYFGVFWAFVQPVITMLLYWFVFQVGLRAASVSEYPFVLYLMSGMIPWFYFQDSLSGATNSLVEYSYLVKKVAFEIRILPAIKIMSALFVHVFFVIFLIGMCCAYGYVPSVYTIQIIYYIVCMVFLVISLSYITASCTAFFRDMTQIVNIALTIGVWLTPIMWNPESVLNQTLITLFRLNPMYYVVDGFRDALLAKQWFWNKPVWSIYFWLFCFLLYLFSVKIFDRLKNHFSDVL